MSPAPTARRALGQLALSLHPVNPPPADTKSADLPTAQLGSTTAPDVREPVQQSLESSPDAPTRTHAPEESEKPTPSDAPTRVDDAQAAALARANANTKMITPVRGPHAELSDTRAHPEVSQRTQQLPSPSRSERPHRGVWLLLGVLLVAGAVGSFLLLKGGVSARLPEPAEPSPARADEPTAGQAAPAEPPLPIEQPAPSSMGNLSTTGYGSAPPAAATPESNVRDTEPAEPRLGRLRVVIIPFGTVYLDGVPMDASPLRLDVEPGLHRVSAGPGTPEQTVRVRPGATSSVEIRTRATSSP